MSTAVRHHTACMHGDMLICPFPIADMLQAIRQEGTSAGTLRGMSAASVRCAVARIGQTDWRRLPFAGDIKKAKDAGYHTCQGLMMQTKKVHSWPTVQALYTLLCCVAWTPQQYEC